MAATRSGAQTAIEEQLEELSPGSVRYRVLAAARDFKASWIDLGGRLIAIRKSADFEAWGHPSFEAYCRRELHIQSATADKLTRSFSYLQDQQPNALEQRDRRELPALDVVDLLSQARERSTLTPKQLTSIGDEVFGPNAPPSKNQVINRMREVDPEAFKAVKKPAESDQDAVLRKALLLADRLQSLLEAIPGISRPALAGVRGAAAELRQRFDAGRT
ncbi:MAG: hypothetical protein V3T05_10385 [Myxococcota bacterium]